MFLNPKWESNQEKQAKDLNKGTANVLDELLGACAHCQSRFSDHEFALLATWVVDRDKDENILNFLKVLKDHQWQKVHEFQCWLGTADDVEAYVVRCPGQNLVIAVIKTHFELFQPTYLVYSEALSAEEGTKLMDAFKYLQWYPMHSEVGSASGNPKL